MCAKRLNSVVLGVLMVLSLAGSAAAVDVGQEAADQIDPLVYRHYLDDLLYTHDGDNRGASGAQHDLARDNIVATFQSFGLQVDLHRFDYGGDYYNVIATQTGTKYPDMCYLIGAHYDSADNPGADDNASGVALIMEVARVLSQYETEYSIKYAAFDLEEWGMVGSYAYAETYSLDGVLGMISVDMVAYDEGDYVCHVDTNYSSSRLWANAVAYAVNRYGGDLTAIHTSDWLGSDHWPFEDYGVPACLLIEGHEDNPCYHMLCDSVDTPDYISYDYATDFARSVAGLLAQKAVAFPLDCDEDGVLDMDEITADPTLDCDVNGRLDTCEYGEDLDCNSNGISDICDILSAMTSEDCDSNNVPDECEDTSLDCNGNGAWDACDIHNGVSFDCNANLVPDECDVLSGTSQDCNTNGILDECELAMNHPVVEQVATGSDYIYAMNFDDVDMSGFNVKQWDDFTLAEATTLDRGEAYFYPPNWSGYASVPFLVEVADAPGGAEAGAGVVFIATGSGQAGTGIVEWDFGGLTLPAGTWWISVQAEGGYDFGIMGWLRTNHGAPLGSEHYFHNPNGAFEEGSAPVPASNTSLSGVPADLGFILVKAGGATDCNGNGVLDECDIRDGHSLDADGSGVPDECEDSEAPQPDPMCFSDPDGLPRPLSTKQITMTAAVATDNTSGIEYMFASGSGSGLSQWRQDPTLVVSNLNTNWPYSYTVKARDTSPFLNETAYSTPAYWTATAIETPAGIEVSNVTATSLQVTALGTFTNLNFGESGLYFELTPPVENSGANGWTSGSSATSLVLSNLSPCTEYTLRVKARNFYGLRGGDYETPWTESVTITTTRLLAGDCNCDNKVDYNDIALLRSAFGSSQGDAAYDADADLDGNGAIDCDDWQIIKASWTGRRVPLFDRCGQTMPGPMPKERATGLILAPRQ